MWCSILLPDFVSHDAVSHVGDGLEFVQPLGVLAEVVECKEKIPEGTLPARLAGRIGIALGASLRWHKS